MPDNVENQLREYIVAQFGHRLDGRALEDDMNLLSEGVVDSMGIMQLVTFVEETFGATVDDEDIIPSNFRSVDAITSLVRSKETA